MELDMTRELQRSEWKIFLDGLSRDFTDWQTKVEVMNTDTGAQILSEGLPFNGLTFDEKVGKEMIELTIGSGTGHHQTHNIVEPTIVAFEKTELGPAGTLEIEDTSGTKTLITFVQPMPVLVKYTSDEIIAVGQ
jgi:hypothetical protein